MCAAPDLFHRFPPGSRPAVLHCAHRMSTVLPCALCEVRDAKNNERHVCTGRRCDQPAVSLKDGLGGSLPLLLVFPPTRSLYSRVMSIRKAAGTWEPMLLGIEPRNCKVCQQGLYRDKTMFRGGWSRCARCDEFVHYSCLASGKVSFLKARPRICKTCRAAEEQAKRVVLPLSSQPAQVGS